MDKKRIKSCTIKIAYEDGTKNIYSTNVFFFTGSITKNGKKGMFVSSVGWDLYDFYKILTAMRKKDKEICKAIFKLYPNYNELFKVFNFVNKYGPEKLEKDTFNISHEDYINIKSMFSAGNIS